MLDAVLYSETTMNKSFYKKILPILLSLLLLLIHIQITVIAADYYGDPETYELNRIKKFEAFVWRKGGTLYLKLKTGALVSLKNSGECSGWDSCEEYEFLDYFKEAGFYHVYLYLGEQSEHLMLSDKTGQKFEVHSTPELSPDGKSFIAVSVSEAFDVNGVFIWRFVGDGLAQELSYEPEEYALYRFKAWIDNKTVQLSKYTRSEKSICPSSKLMTVPVFLRSEEGAWRFDEDLSHTAVRCGQE